MASGFFLGGTAEGMSTAAKQALAERAQEQETGLRSRGLDIQERALARNEQNDFITRIDQRIADTMTQAGAIVKEGLAANRDPDSILKAVQPLVDSAKPLAARVGRDPAALDAQIRASLTSPGSLEAATATGKAEGTKKAVTEMTAEDVLNAATKPGEDRRGFFDPKKLEGENKLRDDYLKLSQKFEVVRDAKQRIDSLDFKENPGAADMALVYSFLHLIDPTTGVKEGEFRTANNISGIPGAVEALRKQILGEGKLADEARNQVIRQSQKM